MPPLNAHRDRRRLSLVVLLTLLPWPAVWLGMYRLDSIVWTFFLYHGCCLLPAAVWGRRLWRGAVRWPSGRQWAWLLAALVCVVPLSLFGYSEIGGRILDTPDIGSVVTGRGFHAAWMLPFGVYFVAVNATLEELFWRGVVLNELRGTSEAVWTAGAVWTAFTFAAWHYLVLRLLLRPGWAEATVLAILAAGVFFSWLYRQTHSIIVPILWHGLVFDLGLVVVFGAVLRT
jgi:membrane protease YdiL (CAAX protease family)